MKKTIALLGIVFALAGCANEKEFYAAQQNRDDNASAERVAKINADAAKWAAFAAIAPKLDAGGAGAVGAMLAMSGDTHGAQVLQTQQNIVPPKDFLDRVEQGARAVNLIANSVTPWALAVEARKGKQSDNAASVAISTSRDNAQVSINGQTVTALRDSVVAAANAPRGATYSYNATGDLVAGGTFSKIIGSYNPVNPNPSACVPIYGAGGIVTGYGGVNCK